MKSDENKCATNYSIITNNKWNVNTHNNMQLTKSTTPMTMLTSTIAWCTQCVERARRAHSSTPGDVISHLIWLKFWANTLSSPCHPWRVLFDSISPFFLYFSFLSFSVYFLHNELFLELDNPIVMASLRYSAAEKSEGTVERLPLLHTISTLKQSRERIQDGSQKCCVLFSFAMSRCHIVSHLSTVLHHYEESFHDSS